MFKKPYRRYSGVKTYRKKYYNKRGATVGLVNKIVTRQIKKNTELKALDSTIGIEMNTTGNSVLLNGIPLGTAINHRIGMRTIVKSIQLSLDAKVNSGGVDQNVRVIVYNKVQNQGALETAATAYNKIYATVTPLAVRNLSYIKEYRVLFDNKFDLGAISKTSSQRTIKKYIKCNIPVVYNLGGAGTAADIDQNALYLLCIGDESAGTSASALVGYVRVRYTDN